MSKRFINSPDKVAKETIRAFALDANQVALHPTHNVLVRSSIALPNNPPRVAVVSGGGSGHEPMPAGFVGQGMLAAAVAGDLFASPSPPAITSMLEAVASSATAILLVVMNYQGDRLNFTMALHTFKQKFPTFPVKMLLVGDDVAIHNSTECRGLAGACFVLKIAGSAADAGCSFEQVVDIAENAISSLVSFGVALEPCTIPGSATDTNRLKENEVELGMGVHGEPGAETILISHFEPASFTTQLVNHICSRLDLALSTNVGAQDDVCTLAILVNNLGAVPQSEMLIAAQAVSDFLFQGTGDVMDGNKHDVYMFIGSYMTSLQMNGLSISCLVIPNTANSSHMRDMLLAPTTCWSWNAGFKLPPPSQRIFLSEGTKELTSSFQMAPDSDGNRTEICISAITSALLERCEEFGQLDQRTGDGDFGITVRNGCERIREDLEKGRYSAAYGNTPRLFELLALSTSDAMGGCSGSLTTLFLNSFSSSLTKQLQKGNTAPWRTAFAYATTMVMETGGAQVGDRTLVDALKPASDVLRDKTRSVAEAAEHARRGCDSTKAMKFAKRGRSVHVRQEMLDGVVDPGAYAVSIILDAIAAIGADHEFD